jgi:CDP-glucose 4,6-dehydratase
MEKLVDLKRFWNGKKVLITGHTGFKGSWLTLLLTELGANVFGFSKDENAERINWLAVKRFLPDDNFELIDICDYYKVKNYVQQVEPNFIFHLAGQPLVHDAFLDPIQTIRTNVLGSSNILELFCNSVLIKSCIIATSDKVYSDSGSTAYDETSKLGGNEIYSASKASVELITSAYSTAYRNLISEKGKGLATVRAGNVLGGGDWSKNRIIPDLFKAVMYKKPLEIRNENYIRPWQYILDVLYGYLMLGKNLSLYPNKFSGAWNFSNPETELQVGLLVKKFQNNLFDKFSINLELVSSNNEDYKFHETKTLLLNSTKAVSSLGWKPYYSVDEIADDTCEWYVNFPKNIESPDLIYNLNLLVIKKFFDKVNS